MFHSFAGRLQADAHQARRPAASVVPAKDGRFDAVSLLHSVRSAITARLMPADQAPSINARRLEVSRTHVARTFHRAFGYPLLIDPARYVGWAVEKNDVGTRRDTRLVACPVRPRPGKSYQKWIDASDGGYVTDMRAHCSDGRPIVVRAETRREQGGFAAGAAIRSACVAPSAKFSEEEVLAIEQFARLIGLDSGTLDILRRRADRRLYVVDISDVEQAVAPPTPLRRRFA